MPKQRQELILTNLCETIAEQMEKEHQVFKEQREGFDDNHDEVHAELQRQLFRTSASVIQKETTPSYRTRTNIEISHHALDHQANI